MDAYGIFFFLIIAISTSSSSSNTFKLLFPDETKLYTYSFFTNVSSIIKSGGDGSYWTLGGRMDVQVLDGFSRARFRLDELKSTVYNRGSNTSEQLKEHAEFLKKPWEVGVCFNAIHTDAEPVWVTNIKRALSFNFLFTESKNSLSTYHSDEPCIHGNCIVVYSPMGSKTRKYYSLIDSKRSRQSTYEQKCLPNGSPENWYRPSYSEDTNNVMSAERLYDIHKTEGLKSLELQSEYQYKSGEHLLSVATVFTLTLSSTSPAVNTQKQNLSSSHLQYASQTHGDPYNGIWKPTQTELKDTTFKNLLEIAKKGIDADNIVRNATLIHSLDFIELLNTMSQLTLTSLQQLFEDVLGTSYELETARNIFLEILPYVRTEDCARLVRHLVMEQKNKIEDAMLVSLIRKLPYTKIEYSKPLLEELEVFTKLGPDFPKEIRHAGVLSFASLVHKTMEVSFDQQYYDEVYDKYLRMYNTCPQYSDRLVWLQGLTNIGKSVVNYLDEIQTDSTKDRHERLWAALASLNIWRGSSLENTLPILMNDTEHIQLRIMALHGFLSSPMGARDLVNVHNYILNCDNQQLKKFWFSTVKNLERNRFYHRYKSASYYIPFIANQVSYPGEQHWATNNYLVGEELSLDSQGPTFQLLTVGGPWNGVPEMALAEFSTGAENTFNVNIYIIAEGVAQNVFQRLLNLNEKEQNLENIKDDLKKLNIKIIEANKVHIDVIVKVQDKTVYATHIDEAKFDTWNADDVKRSIEDFVRFGSHINQQMVYYPIQSVKNFGTEIGTPIRLQSTIVSFTSIRGNLTAPLEEELIWRNDLHIRNQRTSLTSLSTDGPLQPSEHISKIQQSMVLHLPFKLDLKVLPNDKSIELLWTNPSQNGGVAIHSRSQVGVRSKSDKDMYNVANEGLNRDDGIFFDCDRAFSIPDLSQIFFARSYDILTSIQPSHFILNILRLITIPSSGSCGIILPPKQLQTGNKVKLEVNLEEFALRIDDIITNRDVSDGNEEKNCGNENFDGGNDTNVVDAKVSYALSYYRDSGDNADVDTYLSIKGSAALMSNEEKSEININLKSHQSEFGNENDWLFCVDVKQTPICQEGNLNVAFSSGANCSCLSPDSKLTVKYKSLKDSKGRKLEAEISSYNIPKLEVKPNVEQSALTYLLRILSHITSSYNSTTNLEIKERNGFTSISMDGNEKMELRSNVFSWVPGSATVLQVLKRYGFYHKCTIKGPIYERASMGAWYEEKLLLGECTPKPRFEIISPYPDLFTFTTGKDNVYVTGKPLVGDDLKVKTKGNSTIIISQSTGVIVIVNNSKHLYKEMTIYIPQPLMNSVCGICTEPPYLNS